MLNKLEKIGLFLLFLMGHTRRFQFTPAFSTHVMCPLLSTVGEGPDKTRHDGPFQKPALAKLHNALKLFVI